VTKKIRVLIIDDSVFMRKALYRMLSSDPMIEVIDTASDGEEGYLKAEALRPDVITLDVRMPGMDGLDALRKIMANCPVPVLMLSSLTSEGGEVTLRALDLGAVDVIDKSSAHTAMDILGIAGELTSKVRGVAGVDADKILKKQAAFHQTLPVQPCPASANGEMNVVVIGASTGGPPALQEILSKLPADLNFAVLVVQHMPVGFTASLAERLNTLSRLDVSEAFDGDWVRPGRCLIAPSGLHMTLRDEGEPCVRLSKSPEGGLHRPSVDILMESAAKIMGGKAIGVILTGMGSDGARGIKSIHDAGGRTIAQDAESCIVYGMPKVAVSLGGVDRVLPLESIVPAILEELGAAAASWSGDQSKTSNNS
jgi:two-component system chemotaxis response regulator CheB